jgi:hypothetical protein
MKAKLEKLNPIGILVSAIQRSKIESQLNKRQRVEILGYPVEVQGLGLPIELGVNAVEDNEDTVIMPPLDSSRANIADTPDAMFELMSTLLPKEVLDKYINAAEKL